VRLARSHFLGNETEISGKQDSTTGQLTKCANSQWCFRECLDEGGEGFVVAADSGPKSCAAASRPAARPADLAVPSYDRQRLILSLACSVDERPDEAGMKAEVDESSAGPQAPSDLTHDRSEVLHIGMEEHSDGDLDNLVAHGQTAGASLHNGSEPVTS
jgi:hypothetical protein